MTRYETVGVKYIEVGQSTALATSLQHLSLTGRHRNMWISLYKHPDFGHVMEIDDDRDTALVLARMRCACTLLSSSVCPA